MSVGAGFKGGRKAANLFRKVDLAVARRSTALPVFRCFFMKPLPGGTPLLCLTELRVRVESAEMCGDAVHGTARTGAAHLKADRQQPELELRRTHRHPFPPFSGGKKIYGKPCTGSGSNNMPHPCTCTDN